MYWNEEEEEEIRVLRGRVVVVTGLEEEEEIRVLGERVLNSDSPPFRVIQ